MLVVRDTETTVRALDPPCTHQQYVMRWNDGKRKVVCPCHAPGFGLDGTVLEGPAPKPLKVIAASLDGEWSCWVWGTDPGAGLQGWAPNRDFPGNSLRPADRAAAGQSRSAVRVRDAGGSNRSAGARPAVAGTPAAGRVPGARRHGGDPVGNVPMRGRSRPVGPTPVRPLGSGGGLDPARADWHFANTTSVILTDMVRHDRSSRSFCRRRGCLPTVPARSCRC
ncbi:Rieske 2Fe-2S domain-containing protein [Myxococcota bacterium]|nr:Rieske 2Fe-2S domain-containing protein [Myxococcota bacterium]